MSLALVLIPPPRVNKRGEMKGNMDKKWIKAGWSKSLSGGDDSFNVVKPVSDSHLFPSPFMPFDVVYSKSSP